MAEKPEVRVRDRLEVALNRIWSDRAFKTARWAVQKPKDDGTLVWVYTDLDVKVDQSGCMWLETDDETRESRGESLMEAVKLHLAPGNWTSAVRL